MRGFLIPGRILASVAIMLIAASQARAAPAQAAEIPPEQQPIRIRVELQVYPQPQGPMCPGEVYFVTVTPAATATQGGENVSLGAVSGVRITAESSNPRVVSVKTLNPITREDLIFAANTGVEIRSLREGTATVTFRMTPTDRFVTRTLLGAPRVIQTQGNVSARTQRMNLEVRDCQIRLSVNQIGYWAAPNITGYTEGSAEDVILRPDGQGKYTARADFAIKSLTTYGTDVKCTMNAPAVVAPLTLSGELLTRRHLRLNMRFGMANGRLTTTCTAIAPGGSETGDVFDSRHWSHIADIPLGEDQWYRRTDFPGTPGFIDSLYVSAVLEWAD